MLAWWPVGDSKTNGLTCPGWPWGGRWCCEKNGTAVAGLAQGGKGMGTWGAGIGCLMPRCRLGSLYSDLWSVMKEIVPFRQSHRNNEWSCHSRITNHTRATKGWHHSHHSHSGRHTCMCAHTHTCTYTHTHTNVLEPLKPPGEKGVSLLLCIKLPVPL